jgi:hypothetical protein
MSEHSLPDPPPQSVSETPTKIFAQSLIGRREHSPHSFCAPLQRSLDSFTKSPDSFVLGVCVGGWVCGCVCVCARESRFLCVGVGVGGGCGCGWWLWVWVWCVCVCVCGCVGMCVGVHKCEGDCEGECEGDCEGDCE